jgi:hypothetical protein
MLSVAAGTVPLDALYRDPTALAGSNLSSAGTAI